MLYLTRIGSIPLPPGPQICLCLEFPCLLGGWCLQSGSPRGAGRVPTSWRSEWKAQAAPCPEPAPARGPGHRAAWSEVTRGVEPISPAGAGATQTDLNPLCLRMAPRLLEEGFSFSFFHEGKPPSALYQLEAKITCFGNHYLAIRASAR